MAKMVKVGEIWVYRRRRARARMGACRRPCVRARGAACDAVRDADPRLRRLPRCIQRSASLVATAPPLANAKVSHGSEEGHDRTRGRADAYSEGEAEAAGIFVSRDCKSAAYSTTRAWLSCGSRGAAGVCDHSRLMFAR